MTGGARVAYDNWDRPKAWSSLSLSLSLSQFLTVVPREALEIAVGAAMPVMLNPFVGSAIDEHLCCTSAASTLPPPYLVHHHRPI